MSVANPTHDGPVDGLPDNSHPDRNSPTRTLCALAQLDPTISDNIIGRTIGQPLRAWAPDYQVDLVAVLRHAMAARRRRRIRDGCLFVTLLGVPTVVTVDMVNYRGGMATAAVAIVLVGFARWCRRLHRPAKTESDSLPDDSSTVTRLRAGGNFVVARLQPSTWRATTGTLLLVGVCLVYLRWMLSSLGLFVLAGGTALAWLAVVTEIVASRLRVDGVLRPTSPVFRTSPTLTCGDRRR